MDHWRWHHRSLTWTCAVIVYLFVFGCASGGPDRYVTNGTAEITQRGFLDRQTQLVLDRFDARESHEGTITLLSLPDRDPPYYLHLRIRNRLLYSQFYGDSSYRLSNNRYRDRADGVIQLIIRSPDGTVLKQREKNLSNLPSTSSRPGVVDLLLTTFQENQPAEIQSPLDGGSGLRLEWRYRPNDQLTGPNQIDAEIVLESASFS